jgi:hypothetical protein
MRTHIEFRSDKFPAYEGEEEEINPGLWGRRLAEYLRQKLHEQGIETGEIFSEDWGYVVPLEQVAFRMWLGCGHYQEYPDGYLVFIEPSKPMVRNWFKKIDTTEQVGKVADALDRILTSDPEIQAVRWWSESES